MTKVYIILLGILTAVTILTGGYFLTSRFKEAPVEPITESDVAPENISFFDSVYTLTAPMAGIAAFVLNDTLYLLTFTDTSAIYKLGDNGLEKVIDGKDFDLIKRGSFNVEVVDNKAFIIGGAPDKTISGCSAKVGTGAEYDCSTDEVWIFDGSTLVETDNMKHKREVFASGVVNDEIYVIGGWFPNEKDDNEKSVEMFDGETWSEISYSGTYYPVRSAAYATVGEKIYLFGGCLKTEEENPATFSCNTSLVQIFDTKTRTFSQGEEMPGEGRHYSGQHTAVRGKYIYVFGGATALSNEIFDDVAIYDTVTDSWITLQTKLAQKRKSTAAAVWRDKLWIFGGITCDQDKGCPSEGGQKTASNSIEYGEFRPE